ncbi:MAG TPA: carboxypeptidase regulatory-like domain-containing protein, partial [Pyrinomonadaceae bacterium]|nr:carboxypeptidase regulatory-like domain-containing protein [Pyrinomonadaceae bacterium]
ATPLYTIGGRITDANNNPVSGVSVAASPLTTVTTNANGEYTRVGARPNTNYTVTPTLDDFVITPSSRSANSLASNQTLDFTVAQLFDIRGIAKDTTGAPLSGVTISVNGSAIVTTQADGKFELNGRTGGQSYTVKPTKNGFTFSPVQEVVALSADRLDLVFTGTPLTFNVGGTVTRSDNSAPVGGLVVNLKNSAGGAVIGTTTTAGDGAYTFNALAAGANYHVSLAPQAGFIFTPDGRTINNLQADQNAQNFAAVPTNYTISGRVSDAGSNSISGVTMTLTGTASSVANATTATDANGNYSFSVPAGGNYIVTPSKQDYTFTPASKTFNALSANKTGENFAGTLAYTVSGTVTSLGGGALSGVTVNLSGAATGTQTTNAQGQFAFTNLAPGGTYTVTPALANFAFNPPSRTYGTLSASQTAATFEAVSTEPTDLQITGTASATELAPGEDVTYTFTVRNNGPNSAANITVTDNLPATLTFVSCTASQGGTCVGGNASGNNRTVTFPSLAVNATATVTLVARVNSSVADQTVINNTAQVAATNSDTSAQNNAAPTSFKVVVPAATANLSLGVSDSPDPLVVGGNLTYALSVNNAGEADATNVVVTATLPANATFVSAPNGCTRAGNTVTCNLDTVAKGASRVLSIVVQPTVEGTLAFSASVSSDTGDADASDNTAQATTDVHPLGTQVGAGDIIISEFRAHGSNPADASLDDFVELYNTTDAPVTVGPADASGGWALVVREAAGLPVVRATVPKGTVIPARGHFLVTGANYSLAAVAASDLPIAGNLLEGGGLALFRTADPSKFTETDERLDAVGFSSVSDQMYREGSGLAPVDAVEAEQSFARKLGSTGLPQDTGDNAADFQLLSKTVASFGATQAVLGAPGPENRTSPVQRNATIKPSLVDPACGGFGTATSGCARVREGGNAPNAAFGTLTIRRRFTNKTGATVNNLRFRITDITTLGTPGTASLADLRAISSTDVEATVNGSTIIIKGTLLESPHPLGGGLNSALLLPLAGNSLAPNASIDVQFRLGVERNGSFRFFVNVEASTLASASSAQSSNTKDGSAGKPAGQTK